MGALGQHAPAVVDKQQQSLRRGSGVCRGLAEGAKWGSVRADRSCSGRQAAAELETWQSGDAGEGGSAWATHKVLWEMHVT